MPADKTVLLTYDYELFLGKKSGHVSDCLLKPADKLLKVLNRHKVKGIFFVDTLFLWRLKNEQDQNGQTSADYHAVVSQLRDAVKSGHYIFPHLHPHWLDAVFQPETGEWDLSNIRYYRFSSLPADKQTETFDISVNLIREIVAPVAPAYKIDAYRAGGWSIQPFELFKPHFERHGIQYDFSVIPGKKSVSEASVFDFIQAPDKDFYKFENRVENEQPDGHFKELVISTAYGSPFETWCWFKLKGFQKRFGLNKSYGNGAVIDVIGTEQVDIHETKRIKWRWPASMEGLNFITFFIYLRKIIRKPYFQFISHPKILTPLEIRWLNLLLYCIKPFRINSDFRRIII